MNTIIDELLNHSKTRYVTHHTMSVIDPHISSKKWLQRDLNMWWTFLFGDYCNLYIECEVPPIPINPLFKDIKTLEDFKNNIHALHTFFLRYHDWEYETHDEMSGNLCVSVDGAIHIEFIVVPNNEIFEENNRTWSVEDDGVFFHNPDNAKKYCVAQSLPAFLSRFYYETGLMYKLHLENDTITQEDKEYIRNSIIDKRYKNRLYGLEWRDDVISDRVIMKKILHSTTHWYILDENNKLQSIPSNHPAIHLTQFT